jgi:hypothetical protein
VGEDANADLGRDGMINMCFDFIMFLWFFGDAVTTEYIVSNDRMTVELERTGKELVFT